jgi:hypothetical protein
MSLKTMMLAVYNTVNAQAAVARVEFSSTMDSATYGESLASCLSSEF